MGSDTIRILHLDDDPAFVDATAEYLVEVDERFTIETATTVSDGWEILSDQRIDCVISDYKMPEKDGIEFLESIREKYPSLPVILFTGKGSEQVASEAIRAGVTEYWQKNGHAESYELLANRIENVVSQYRAERRAKRTERRLKDLSEATTDILWLFRADWSEVLFVNSAYEELWGRSMENLQENPLDFLEAVHPDDIEQVREDMERVSRGNSTDIEFRIVHPDGTRRWIWALGEPVTDESGTVRRIAGFCRDVTEKKERERALREEREFTEQSLNALDDLFYVYDTDENILHWNDRISEVSGYSDEEIAKMAPKDFFPESSHQEISDVIEQIYDDGRSRHQAKFKRKDGELIPYEFTNVEMTDTAGNVQGFAGIGRDIREQRSRERDLEQYQQIVNAVDDAVFVIGEDKRVVTANEAAISFAEADGISSEHPSIESLVDSFATSREDATEFLETVEQAFEDPVDIPTPQVVEINISSNGDERTVEYQLSPFTVEDEKRIAVIARNVTDRKERERILERKNQRLDEFAALVSHDLRNPLNLATLRLDLAQQECESSHLDQVDQALHRMEELINDILALAREDETIEETQPVSIESVAKRCWEGIDTEQATLEIRDDRRIRADPGKLEILLQNLLENAVAHGTRTATATTEAGQENQSSAELTVKIGPSEDGFYIEDDGPGIEPAKRDTIFESGFTTSEGGIGLGLSMVRQVVTAHDWDIDVTQSSLGGGETTSKESESSQSERFAGARFEISGIEFAD